MVNSLEFSNPAGSKVTGWFQKNARILTIAALAAILLLGAFLRLYHLGEDGYGNAYYAATVKSMLTSWHNFFFASYDPGGVVSVDKPPFGFWMEAVSAYFLGVNGFALALPNALAGIFSIFLLFSLVRRPFGRLAGLAAALVLAVMPITIAAERNNTIDGMLVCALLLAAWAFVRSANTGRLRWLLLGGALIGVGFNIKMLQAYMIVPGLFLFYLLAAPHRWWKRFLQLGLATLVMLVVSFAWVAVVELTPASERPYVGSSETNSMLELIIGHNGLDRFTRGGSNLLYASASGSDNPMPFPAGENGAQGFAPAQGSNTANPRGARPNRPQGAEDGTLPALQPGTSGGGPGGSEEVGTAGILRLFTQPLAEQSSWLLPLALLGIPFALFTAGPLRKQSEQRDAIVLWAGWLIPMMLYFSFASGTMHTYYLIMLGPAIAALTAIAGWCFVRLWTSRPAYGITAAFVVTALTLGFEILTLLNFPAYAAALGGTMLSLWVAGVALFWIARNRSGALRATAAGLVALALLLPVGTWALMTATTWSANGSLPKAGPTAENNSRGGATSDLSQNQQALLDYLLENNTKTSVLFATQSAQTASPFLLATDREVIALGGFTGSDNIYTVDEFAQMVEDGTVRYYLGNARAAGRNANAGNDIAVWVAANCHLVDLQDIQTSSAGSASIAAGGEAAGLYDCAGN